MFHSNPIRIHTNSIHLLRFALIYVLIGASFTATGQNSRNLQEQYQLKIKRSNDPIRIDGALDETAWQNADKADNFWMSFPVDDQRAPQDIQTEVRFTYDDQYLYVGAICYGPDDYIIKSLKRDNLGFWEGDAFSILLDPVNERTNAFNFAVNPANVQSDALINGQTMRRGTGNFSGINDAWDNKWFSAVQTATDHWTVELAIPFRILRYKSSQTTWGLNFARGEPRSNSWHTWSPVPVQFISMDLGYTGVLLWDQPPPAVKSNISVIPYVSANSHNNVEEGEATTTGINAGVDAKVAVTSSLNLDLTVNPDFSQVEVDQQVTNLTTFDVLFPERRLFFLENSDLFSDFGIPPMRPFFSRRIGLDEDGNTIPIQYGLRLSGNLNKDLRIGLMNMQTKGINDQPGNNYTSLALHRQFFKRSVLRGYFHNRQGHADKSLLADDYNRTAGMEFNFVTQDGSTRAFGGYGMSFSDHIRNQNNSFYNIGAGYDNRNISIYSNLAGVGDNYYADLGFIPTQEHYDAIRDTTYHLGFNHLFSRASYTYYPENNGKIISHTWYLNHMRDWTTRASELIQNSFRTNYNISWKNTSMFLLEFNHQVNQLLYPFTFTDEPLPTGIYRYNTIGAIYVTDQRRLFSALFGISTGGFYNGKRQQYQLMFSYRKQPWGKFDLSFEQNNIRLPSNYGNENLLLVGPRIEINFSNNLSWTTFLQYNTQDDNFNINSRFQWRYQPMSDIYLVYTDNYAVEYWGPKNRAVVLKMNYWLNI